MIVLGCPLRFFIPSPSSAPVLFLLEYELIARIPGGLDSETQETFACPGSSGASPASSHLHYGDQEQTNCRRCRWLGYGRLSWPPCLLPVLNWVFCRTCTWLAPHHNFNTCFPSCTKSGEEIARISPNILAETLCRLIGRCEVMALAAPPYCPGNTLQTGRKMLWAT